MAGVILSHEPEVSPCGLHRVATLRWWPGQRHRWLIRWEAQINKTTHTHLQTLTMLPNLPLKCLKPRLSETNSRGRGKVSPRSRSTCEARLLLRVMVMAEFPHSTTGCSLCQISEGFGLWPLTLSWPYAQKHSIWLYWCGTSGEMQRLQINQ